jgi:hypothetical protein
MRLAATALVLIAAILTAGAGGRQSTTLSPERIPDLFPIMPWELQPEKQVFLDEPEHGIQSLRACGFDTVAFVRPDQLEEVERAGMRALVGRASDLRLNWREMSGEAIFEHVKKLVDESGESEALIGFFIADEPRAAEFPALRKAVAAVRRLAPGKLAYVNLYPSYASRAQLGTKSYTEYLARYLAVVKPQFLSYDNYAVQYSIDLVDRARAGQYFTNLVQVRRVALKHGLPFWNALSSNQIRPYTTVPSPANLALQAYTTLAAGARGLTWFTYYAGRYSYAPIDRAGKRTVTWSYVEMVNEQVQGLKPILARVRSTGVYFSAPPPAAGLPRLPGKLVTSVRSPTAVMIGEFAGGQDERYAMVVNLSLARSAKVIVRTQAESVRRVSPVDRSLSPLGGDGSLWLPAGQGALLKLEGRGVVQTK